MDCSGAAPWTCATPGAVWSDDVRRRIRAFGILAYVRGAAPGARMRLDRVRRLGWPRAADSGLTVLDLHGSATVPRWTPIEASFRLSQATLNPYDPDYADVVGEVVAPDGAKFVHPAYWFEPYRLAFDGTTERAVADGTGSWRWRWTPPTPGAWRWRVVAKLKVRDDWQHAESPWQTTTVSGEAGGLVPVRVDPIDRRWFSDVEGRFWFPIGVNLRSPGDERQDPNLDRECAFAVSGGDDRGRQPSVEASSPPPTSRAPGPAPPATAPPAGLATADVHSWHSLDWERRGTRSYERWLPILHANGIDWARVWMCPWWCGLEWRKDWNDFNGLTWFNQANAARMDRVVELAAANHVYLQVELMNHGMVGEAADRQWADSPYNRALGGPCRGVGEWFRSDEVWSTNAKRWRYTLARWGGCSGIAAWSLCSELEFTGTFLNEAGGDYGHSPTLERWVRRSLDWMRGHDPYPDRPVTIHFSHPWSDPRVWRTEGLGFSNSNIYTAFQEFDTSLSKGRKSAVRDLPLALESYLDDLFPPGQLKRPTLIGEWGGHWADNEPWTLRGELRTGLWLQACTPYAGDTGFWWWLWLDVSDRWSEYAAVAAFVRGEDPRGVDWRRIRPLVRGAENRLFAQGMRCDNRIRLYCWPRGFDQDFRRTASGAAGTIVLDGLVPGTRWRAQRYDCATGAVTATTELTVAADGHFDLPIAGLDPDAAFKLEKAR